MTAPKADGPFFAWRGAIEGFYGPYYTAAQRQELLRFFDQHGFNLYIYAPKNDPCHRDEWRRPYSRAEMASFAETIAVASTAGLTFCYGLSPSAGLRYADPDEFAAIITKLEAFYRLGARAFALLLDDVTPCLVSPEDVELYPSPSVAQADLCNRVFGWLQEHAPDYPLFVCPTNYAGRAPFPEALHVFGGLLHPSIELFYTGPEVCSPEITVGDVTVFATATGRLPVIWDNYPVNDLAMAPELHLGPLRGRDASLHAHTRGYVANLMLQPVASQVALQTTGEYLRGPYDYDPAAAWERALRTAAGSAAYPAMHRFAENNLFSALNPEPPELLTTLAAAALTSLKLGEQAAGSSAVDALRQYLSTLGQDCQELHAHLEGSTLLTELLPWLELLEMWTELGLQALALLRAPENQWPAHEAAKLLGEIRATVTSHRCRIAGNALLPLADYALETSAPAVQSPRLAHRAQAVQAQSNPSPDPLTTS